MSEVLTSAQMRAIEQAEVASGRSTWLGLMERACRSVCAAIARHRPAPGRAVVLCGPGNNGGDGYGTAALLRAGGWAVEVFALGDPARQTGAAAEMLARWGGPVGPLAAAGTGPRADLLVDAVFGIGLSRAAPAEVVAAHRAVRRRAGRHPGAPTRVVAIDCPSGLDAETGMLRVADAPRGAARAPMAADLTLTFHAPKPGHFLHDGPEVCGALEVVPLGLADPPPPIAERAAWQARRAGRALLVDRRSHGSALRLRRALLGRARHKYERGHALVLAGGPGRGGAARLAARAALRAGAGLVTLGVPPAALYEHAAQLNAVMLRGVADHFALAGMLEDARLSALCLGPGLGVGQGTRDLVQRALAGARATVLDADALTSFSRDPEVLMRLLHPRTVLTPHGGEFARLFPDLAPAPEGGRSALDAVRAAAARAGCVVLLKGPATVIAAPDGRAALHAALYADAVPWLATAGAGDVLAGLIAGLIARPQPLDVLRATCTAVWLHAEAARRAGPGLIAEDLADRVPEVLRAAGLDHR